MIMSKPSQFDINYLKAIHKRILKDDPEAKDIMPGEFRSEVKAEFDWCKDRKLESVKAWSFIAYSSMDTDIQTKLSAILQHIDTHQLSKLNTKAFTQAISTLYTELDYIHPFRDGNSRTLRKFIREIAKASGYKLDWNPFNKNGISRDNLCIARDLAVNKLSLPHIQDPHNKRTVLYNMDQFAGNRSLTDLLGDVIRPQRAIAFKMQPNHKAIETYPELKEALTLLESARKHFGKMFQISSEDKEKIFSKTEAYIQQQLDQGEPLNVERIQAKLNESTSVKSEEKDNDPSL